MRPTFLNYFLASQNILFRGHRDDGPLLRSNEFDLSSKLNEENFRQIIQFCFESGDKELEDRLENTSSKATYVKKKKAE